jgi:DNA (cytosine-5)-methyltransferase 1
MGKGRIDDPRRSLLGEFFRIVNDVKPSFFLMENVPGLIFPKNRPILDAAIASLDQCFTVLGPVVLDASAFGAPTKRKRVFVFGFDHRRMRVPTLADITYCERPATTVRDAIEDLLNVAVVGDKADLWRYKSNDNISTYAAEMRSASGLFTGNQLTEHRPDTVVRFSSVPQGGVDLVGRYPRLSWSGLCPTLRAGTGSDKGSFQAVRPLHPTQHRVITPREAARLQGFPDDFIFHPTVWHSCRMIGNSVSPIISQVLLSNIRKFINSEFENLKPARVRHQKAYAV